MFNSSWPCDRTKSKAYNHGFMLNSCWVTWWVHIMNSWFGSGSLDFRFMMAACTALAGPKISLAELEDEWLVEWTKDERSKSSMSRRSHVLLSITNLTLWEKKMV